MRYLALALLALSFNAQAEIWATPNVNGGFIFLLEDECEVAEWKEQYQYKMVATNDKSVPIDSTDKTQAVSGCYTMPNDRPPMAGMFPIVSVILIDPVTGETLRDEHPFPIYRKLEPADQL
jgi:hypothetical protein